MTVLERLIRIEVLLETKFSEVQIKLTDHEERLRKGEAWRYAAPISLIIALGSVVAALIGGR
jgi:hypothetical protein